MRSIESNSYKSPSKYRKQIQQTVIEQVPDSEGPSENRLINSQKTGRIDIEKELQEQFQKYDVLKTKIQQTHHKYNTTSLETPREDQTYYDQTATKNNNKSHFLGDDTPKKSDVFQDDYIYDANTGQLSRWKAQTLKNSELQEMFKRFQIYQKKRKAEIEQKTRELEAQESRQAKFKPNLASKSIQINKELKNDPIYKRYEKIVLKKNQKIAEIALKKRQKEEEQYRQFVQQYEKLHPKLESVRNYEDFYQEMLRWKKKKDEKMKQKQEENLKVEMNSVTFKPQLNKKSKVIHQKLKDPPIHLRELQAKPIIQLYSFKPKINKLRP